jgi:hypothetical protein
MNYKTPLSVTNTSNLSIIDSEGSGNGCLDLISGFTLSPGLDVSGKVTIDVGSSEVNIESNYTLHAVMASGGFVLDSGYVTVTTDGPGLASVGDVIISGGKLYIDAGYIAISTNSAKSLIVNGGYLNANSGSGNVINTGSVAINGGHVAAFKPIVTNPNDAEHKTLSGGTLETKGGVGNVFTFTGGIYSVVDGSDEHEITVRGSNAVWPENLDLPNSNDTVTIEAGATLTIPEDVELILAGTIYNFGTVINNGDIDISGEGSDGGSIQNYDGNNDDVSGTFINNGSIEIESVYNSPPASIDNGNGENNYGVFQNNGEIVNGGRIVNEYGVFTNASGATLTNESGAEIDNEYGELNNSGTLINETGAEIDNQNGKINNSGTLTNDNGANIDNTGGTIYNNGTYNGDGSISGSLPEDTNLANIATIAPIPDQIFTGNPITPAISLTAPIGITSADYTVEYSNNVNVGTATVTVTGKGIYGGSKQATFTINKADISALTPANIADQIHSGNAITPALTITYNGKTLVAGTDYDAIYTNNVNVGTASVAITGKGNFTGTKTASFNIIAAKQNEGPNQQNEDSSQQTDGLIDLATFSTNAKASTANRIAVSDKTWTGKALKSGFAITAGGKKLKAGTDYTITANGANKDIGKGSITIKGTGNYKGTKVLSFKITPKKGTIKKLTVGKKTLTIKWSKLSAPQKITGYKVEYKIKGATKWKMQTVSAKKTSLVIKELKKGKKYQVRIYAYKTIKSGANKGTYTAPYSAVKTSAKVK